MKPQNLMAAKAIKAPRRTKTAPGSSCGLSIVAGVEDHGTGIITEIGSETRVIFTLSSGIIILTTNWDIDAQDIDRWILTTIGGFLFADDG
jgi:hypothetical protein